MDNNHKLMQFLQKLSNKRTTARDNIVDYRVLESRSLQINKATNSSLIGKGVLYWMIRDHRVDDNWALIFAQRKALEHKAPLHVAYCLSPDMKESTFRHVNFLLGGLKKVYEECTSLNIAFHLLFGYPGAEIPKVIQNFGIGTLVVDFSPLKVPKKWIEDVKVDLSIPIIQVDAHNIVPCWITSDKLENAAKTIRPKINYHLKKYLVEFPDVIKHPFTDNAPQNDVNWDVEFLNVDGFIDMTVSQVEWAQPGTMFGLKTLFEFCETRLKDYSMLRNNPTVDAISHISPWMHFGQVAPQRVILTVNEYHSSYPESVEKFVDECLVWRELADNFCQYNSNYDNFIGAPNWAKETLDLHSSDERKYLYSKEDFEKGNTHDPFWNAAQNQLLTEGKIHGYVRMYWAKKILEWSASPALAVEIAIHLNDRYSLDGSDPNGYAGIMWSLCGSHDNQFPERLIYGTVRCMTEHGLERKFDAAKYIKQYNGKRRPCNTKSC